MADTNLGYSGGNNLGCKCAIADGCDYIAIVNSDIEFKNDIISVMVQDIKRDVAVVGPKIVMLDGGDGQHLIRTYNYLDAVLDRYPFFVLKKWFNIGCVKRNTNYPEFFGMVSGCCFLIDAKCFEEIDFFDDNVFLYSEERILSIKLKEIGKKACYDNSAVVLHKEGKSTEKKGTPFSDYHRYISDYYTVIRYIKPSKLKLFFLKYIRLFIFRMKCIKNKDYNIQYKRLKTKMREVENGNYKITP